MTVSLLFPCIFIIASSDVAADDGVAVFGVADAASVGGANAADAGGADVADVGGADVADVSGTDGADVSGADASDDATPDEKGALVETNEKPSYVSNFRIHKVLPCKCF